MARNHTAYNEDGDRETISLYDIPDECPLCHTKGTLSPLSLYTNNTDRSLEVIFRCPNSNCYEVFIGYYDQIDVSTFALRGTKPRNHLGREFSNTINKLSPSFPDIYNQALEAENGDLNLISGPGYRKALEFLIKDYLIKKTPEQSEEIKKEFLGTAIKNRIETGSIKDVAKRAVWLGNDETHYERKWNEKDLQDLKLLINLTVHWIEQEFITEQLLKDMPEEGK